METFDAMLSPEQIASIRRLFYAEHWKIGTIATQLGIHHDSVRSAIRTESFNSARVARASLTDPYLDFIRQTLEQYPRLRSTRLYQMLGDRGYTGSVVLLRRVVAKLRPTRREAFLRLSVLPGEEAQADWAHFGEVKIGRATRRLSAFVLTLSYSRALYLEFFLDQTLENFFLGHVHAFTDWGGVPRSVLFDNLKAVVLERHGNAVHFHPRLLELCAHYHFEPRPCRPARGNEKGRVERAIQYVRHSFFAARHFTNLADFNRQALLWRETVAHQRPCQADDARSVAETFAFEQPLLLPLPAHPFDTDFVSPIRSDKTIYVRFDKNDYSIPHQAVGRLLTLVASPSTVRLLDGQVEIARHRRSFDRHERIEDPEHISALLAEKRKALGHTAVARLRHAVPNIEEFFQAAVERGELVSRLTRRLLGLLDDYGAEELHAAVTEALSHQTPRDSSVAFILIRRHRASRRRPPLPVDMSRHPDLEQIDVPSHSLEVYDDLSTRIRSVKNVSDKAK
jgi:transposase